MSNDNALIKITHIREDGSRVKRMIQVEESMEIGVLTYGTRPSIIVLRNPRYRFSDDDAAEGIFAPMKGHQSLLAEDGDYRPAEELFGELSPLERLPE